MEQNPFPEERKKREEGRQAPQTKEERRRETSTRTNTSPDRRK
jgi:hypothetical protein